jgi:DNA-directed RNA polymerase specialized sigma24 family protein
MAKPSVVEEPNDRAEGMTTFESRLVSLLGLLVVQERKQSDQIGLLGRAGFPSAEIAALLGTTRNTVSVELSNQRKAKKAKKGKKAKG